jgi:hypothetical protein
MPSVVTLDDVKRVTLDVTGVSSQQVGRREVTPSQASLLLSRPVWTVQGIRPFLPREVGTQHPEAARMQHLRTLPLPRDSGPETPVKPMPLRRWKTGVQDRGQGIAIIPRNDRFPRPALLFRTVHDCHDVVSLRDRFASTRDGLRSRLVTVATRTLYFAVKERAREPIRSSPSESRGGDWLSDPRRRVTDLPSWGRPALQSGHRAG